MPERSGARSGADQGVSRLFLAVDLPHASRTSLENALRATSLPGRPVPEQNRHITLRFLGDTDPRVRDEVLDELARRDLGESFALTLAGAGAFPRPARATTLWVAVGYGRSLLEKLAAEVEIAVQRCGFLAEQRPYHPHLTVARSRSPLDARGWVAQLNELSVPVPVTEIVLVRSTLGGGPPQYDVVARVPLETSDPGPA